MVFENSFELLRKNTTCQLFCDVLDFASLLPFPLRLCVKKLPGNSAKHLQSIEVLPVHGKTTWRPNNLLRQAWLWTRSESGIITGGIDDARAQWRKVIPASRKQKRRQWLSRTTA